MDNNGEVTTAFPLQRLTWHQHKVLGRAARIGEISWGEDVTVAFVHGFSSSPLYANRAAIETLANTPAMRAAKVRFLAPILPGFGATPPLRQARFSLDDYAQWYIKALEASGCRGPLILLGESMGGALSCLIANQAPDTIKALLLVNSVGGESQRVGRSPWVRGALQMSTPRRGSNRQWIASVADAALSVAHLRSSWRVADQVMATNLSATLADLATKNIPTVTLFSQQDPLVPPATSVTFSKLLGVTPLFIAGDHRSFIDRHPATSVLLDAMVTTVASGDALSKDPTQQFGAELLEAHGMSTAFSGIDPIDGTDAVGGFTVRSRAWNVDRPGNPVVFVHGLASSGRYGIPFCQALAENNVPTFAPDLPGYGRSPRAPHFLDTKALGAILATWIRDRGLTEVTVVANSYGCQIAAAAARSDPDRFERLVFVGAVDDRVTHPLVHVGRGLRVARHERLWDLALKPVELAHMGLRNGLRTLTELTRYQLWEELKSLPVALTVVRGENDSISPHDWNAALAERFSDDPLLEVPGSGHDAHAHSPHALARLVLPRR